MSATQNNEPQPSDPRPQPTSVAALYEEHALKLRCVLPAQVATSDANLDDACSFAWTQLVATRPRRESIFSWLLTVATREAWRLDRLERRQAIGDNDLTIEAVASPTADAHAEDRAHLAEVVEGLKTIHCRKRRMLVLHAAGWTFKEIGAEYGVSTARARELVYRARLQLRDRVDRGDGAPRGDGANRPALT